MVLIARTVSRRVGEGVLLSRTSLDLEKVVTDDPW
jgi:hypothetical protein